MAKEKKTSSLNDVISKYATKTSPPEYEIRPAVLNSLWSNFHLGSMYALWAPEGAGKTTLTAQAIRHLAGVHKLKGLVVDVEKALNENQQMAFKIKEFVDNGTITIVTCMNFLELEEILMSLPGSDIKWVMIDSWSAVKPYTPDGMKVSDIRPGLQAQQEGTVISKLKQICYNSEIGAIILAHARANIQIGHVNMYAPATKMAGSFSLKHMVDVVTEIQTHGKIKDDDGNVKGVEITIQTTKCKWTAPYVPYREKLYYGVGIDPRYSIVDRALELGLAVKEGRTIRIPGWDQTYNRKTIYEAPQELLIMLRDKIKQMDTEGVE